MLCAFTFRCAAMPPKQMIESSGFSRLTAWMLPKPTADGAEQQNADKTPTPTEVAESSRGSPTELVDNTAFDYYFEQNTAYDNETGYASDDLATDEAAAITEAMAEAAALNTTLQCHLGAKRPREEEKATAVAVPPEEQPEGSGVSCKPYPSRPNFWPQKPIVKLSNCQVRPFPFVLALGGPQKALTK